LAAEVGGLLVPQLTGHHLPGLPLRQELARRDHPLFVQPRFGASSEIFEKVSLKLPDTYGAATGHQLFIVQTLPGEPGPSVGSTHQVASFNFNSRHDYALHNVLENPLETLTPNPAQTPFRFLPIHPFSLDLTQNSSPLSTRSSFYLYILHSASRMDPRQWYFKFSGIGGRMSFSSGNSICRPNGDGSGEILCAQESHKDLKYLRNVPTPDFMIFQFRPLGVVSGDRRANA
jgi:hypothetical protein